MLMYAALEGDKGVALRFREFPTFAHDRLLSALEGIEKRLEAAVISAEPEKSGLLKSLTGGRVYDHGTRIAAVVGVRAMTKDEALKASALEYGSNKSITLRAHSASLSHLWSRAINTIQVQVSAHSRITNVQAHNFLRGPIDTIRGEALAELEAAIELSTQDAMK